MSFKLNKEALLKSGLCPPGLIEATLVKVYPPYLKTAKNGEAMTVQQADFETKKGYTVATWFNSIVMTNIFEFVAAADKVTFDPDTFADVDIELKDYVGKEVVISVAHGKTDAGRIVAQIDNFYQTGQVPF
jgi:hypothetical protein